MENENVRFSQRDLYKIFRMIWWLRAHPVHGIKLVMNIELTPHERILVRNTLGENIDTVLWLLSRGLAKTTMLWILSVYVSILWSRSNIPLLGPDFRRGKDLFIQFEKYMNGEVVGMPPSDFVRNSIIFNRNKSIINRDPDAWLVRFKNGSRIGTMPLISSRLKDRSGIRGFRASRMMATDESADISEKMWSSVILPFARVKNWTAKNYQFTRIQAGTMDLAGSRFYREAKEHKKGMLKNDGRKYIEFNYKDTYYFTEPVEVTEDNYEELLESEKLCFTYPIALKEVWLDKFTGDIYSFLLENRNILVSTPDRVFPPILIKKAVGLRNKEGTFLDVQGEEDDYSPPGVVSLLESSTLTTVIGCDIARSSINDVAYIALTRREDLEKEFGLGETWAISAIRLMKNKDFMFMALELWRLLERFPNTAKVIMDKRGGGMALADILARGSKSSDGSWEYVPIYDPTFTKDVDLTGKMLLHLDASSDISNEYRVMKLRNYLEKRKLVIPYYNIKLSGSKLLDEEYENLRELIKQLQGVKSSLTMNARKYFVEIGGNRRYKKDLFSAILLAIFGVEHLNEHYIDTESAYGFWL